MPQTKKSGITKTKKNEQLYFPINNKKTTMTGHHHQDKYSLKQMGKNNNKTNTTLLSKRNRQTQENELQKLKSHVQNLEERLQFYEPVHHDEYIQISHHKSIEEPIQNKSQRYVKKPKMQDKAAQIEVSLKPSQNTTTCNRRNKSANLHIQKTSCEFMMDFEVSSHVTALNKFMMSLPASETKDFPITKSVEPRTNELVTLLKHAQYEADQYKGVVENSFSHIKPFNYEGCTVRAIQNTNSLSAFTSKFYPNVVLDNLQRDFVSYATGEKAISENVFYKHVYSIRDDASIVDIRMVGELCLLAYGKTEMAIRLLISKWDCGDHYMFCINSLDIPDINDVEDDCIQWACNGWLQMKSLTVDGVSGVLVRRYNTFGYCEKMDQKNQFLPVERFPDHMVLALLRLLDSFDNIVHRIKENESL